MAAVRKLDQVIFISDVHFGVRNGSIEWLDNITDYFYRFFIPLVEDQIRKKHKPCIVIAGDYFDNRQSIDINVLNRAMDVMEKLAGLCPVYAMLGNHDLYKKCDNDITSMRSMENIKNVTLIAKEYVLDVSGVTFLLNSWVGDFKEENRIIAENKDKYDYLVFHTELSGMTYDNNRPIVGGLNMDIADDNCRILSGHIHKRQESKKGIYFGSPYHLTRSDIGNTKGIYIYNIKDGKAERMFVDNKLSPEFTSVRFSDYGRDPNLWGDVAFGNYIDITFTEKETDVVNVNKFIEELNKMWSPRKIEIRIEREKIDLHSEEVTVDENGEMIDLRIDPDSTVEEIFEKKLAAFKLKKKDEKAMNKMNVEYLKRAEEELR